MSTGYVRYDGNWEEITGVAFYSSGAWHTRNGYVWFRGAWDDYTVRIIENMEGSTYVGDHFRGSESGNAYLIPEAALVPDLGSTQGLHCDGFVERYAMPGDHANPLYTGVETSFYLYPRILESQAHFQVALQDHYEHPPDGCYRLELHLGNGGSRLVKMSLSDPSDHESDRTREILSTENDTEWTEELHKIRFVSDYSGTWFVVETVEDGATVVSHSTSDSEYVDADTLGFGFRCGGDAIVDYDWLDYEEEPPTRE